jgi:hemerythrin
MIVRLSLTKDMELGVPQIDSQHRELIDRLNKVLELGSKSVTVAETQ